MKLCIFLAKGFEEGEAVNTIDIIRRADLKIDVISISDKLEVTGSHNITIISDKLISDVSDYNKEYDVFIIPGGPGVKELEKSEQLKNIFIDAAKNNKKIAAICAAPSLLLKWNILNDHVITCYPNSLKYNKIDSKVAAIVDKNIITGASIGTSIKFAILIVENILGKNQKTQNLIDKLIIR